MFEQYKLNKYRDCMKGYAYEVMYESSFNKTSIQIYLVIDKDGKNEFIKYKKIKNLGLNMVECTKNSFEKNGYKPLSYYILGKDKCKVYKMPNAKRIK